MKTTHDHIRERLLARAGIDIPKPKYTPDDIERLERTQWSNEFEILMRNRLLMGALRYGELQAPNKPVFDSIKSIKKRLDLYQQTGNTEHLADIANLCLVEFVEGVHPLKHFHATDEHDYHAKEN